MFHLQQKMTEEKKDRVCGSRRHGDALGLQHREEEAGDVCSRPVGLDRETLSQEKKMWNTTQSLPSHKGIVLFVTTQRQSIDCQGLAG
jgi:hypothetical protein